MGAQGKNSPTSNPMQRVKVYRLNDTGKWDDRGTGHVSVDCCQGSENLGLFVIDEDDHETILMHRISPADIYRRQEETIISWLDPELSTDLALSFQEATGCSFIWDHICTVQRDLQISNLGKVENGTHPASESLETSETSHANDEALRSVKSELRDFPSVELSTLPLILKTVVESGITDQMHVVDLVLQDQEFFPKLMELFRMCEDVEDLDGLHKIFKLVKGIILLNSTPIFEKLFGDEFIMDVIGCLEYDPEVPQVQHHRAFLKEHVVFKEAIPIKDPIVLSKIHQTYKVGYIKDVILPRVLDEATIGNLNSIIHSNNAVVVSLLKEDTAFIQELFARMKSPTTSAESKKNLILFLQEFCSLSKSMQLVQQLRLFRDLVNEGLFDIITDALQSPDKRLVLTGTDILILFLNQDPSLLRTYVLQQEGKSLFGLLVKGMIMDFGEDMHCQFLEILRILLDSYTLSGSQRDAIVDIFYDKYLDQLIDVIVTSCPPKDVPRTNVKSAIWSGRTEVQAVTTPEILLNICELLCFCVVHHSTRIRYYFLRSNVIEKVLFLIRRNEKYLVAAAVRFLRNIISRNDEHLLHHIVTNDLMKPIIDAFISNGDRYNLLHSAVLELFEYIRKENLKSLILYIVDSFWEELTKFEHLSSIQSLKVKYDQSLEKYEVRNTVSMVDPRKRADERDLDKEEQDYFNGDSDEEDTASARISNTQNQRRRSALPNSGSYFSPRGGLVDYDDDEDDDDYNPPSRSKQGMPTGDERLADSPALKRRCTDNNNEELELPKKQRLDKNMIGAAASCSTLSCGDSPGKKAEAATPDTLHTAEGNNGSAEQHSVNKLDDSRDSSNCSPNDADTRQCEDLRQSSGEDCPLVPISKSTSEMAVSGTTVNGSEPYSVR
ncbi:serine/threonine-protein phosphatase 4 regulatory subunit 3-like protein isoform X1 [Cinnamomum micranthum f. kanehirae]|uniref:Serine/threonine-protein phosphatase 4 regulatory subunit 3-like protein isoform X1 n=1 Tax=Cinnamomum micranthum f. kanehirae TaxID=337451 RepID=A0A3S3N865_9MAGN|nr:serine/threonine-protein phosphatase 4 regulatory subunit 3-like protein isoform X1 [Cinnamomum micranthum f. kanehirae]